MAGIINDKFGERMEAGPSDSDEDEKKKRRKVNRSRP